MYANNFMVAIFLVSIEMCRCGTISEEVMLATNEYDHYSATFKNRDGDELFIGAKNQISKHSWFNLRKIASLQLKPQCQAAGADCYNYVDFVQRSSSSADNENDGLLVCATMRDGKWFEANCHFLDLSIEASEVVVDIKQRHESPFFQMTTDQKDPSKIYYIALQDKIIGRNLGNKETILETTDKQVNKTETVFIGGYWFKNRAYFLFNEGLAEVQSGRRRGTRLAEICTKDTGREFVSFQKSFLRCGKQTIGTNFDNLVTFSPLYDIEKQEKSVSGLLIFSKNSTNGAAFCAYDFDGIPYEFYDDPVFYCWGPNTLEPARNKENLKDNHKKCEFNNRQEALRCPIRQKLQSDDPYYYNLNRNIAKLVAIKVDSSKYIFAMTTNGKLEFHAYNSNKGTGCLMDTFVIEEEAQSSDTYHMDFIPQPFTLIIGTKSKLVKIDGNAFCKVHKDEYSCLNSAARFCFWHTECIAIGHFAVRSKLRPKQSQAKDCSDPAPVWGPWSLPYSCNDAKQQCFVTGVLSPKCKNEEQRCTCISRVCLNPNGCENVGEGELQRNFAHCEPLSLAFGSEGILGILSSSSAYWIILVSFLVAIAILTAGLIAMCNGQSATAKLKSAARKSSGANTQVSTLSTVSRLDSKSTSYSAMPSTSTFEAIDRPKAHKRNYRR